MLRTGYLWLLYTITDPFIQSTYKYCVERMNNIALAFIFISSRKVLIGNP